MTQNNYVKDIENKDKLESDLQGIEGIGDFDFTKFDEDVEASFQKDFLDKNKDNFLSFTNQQKQNLFNGWLNSQVDKIDAFENNEIAKKIIPPTTFELQNLKTLAELEIFQGQLQAEKNNTKKIETITLGETEIAINFYNGVTSTKVVSEINGSSFQGKREIIDLLTQKKVKELQQKIGGDKNGNSYENLPIYGDDGMFGTETFEALQTYIEKNKINEEKENDNGDREIDTDRTNEGTGGGSNSGDETQQTQETIEERQTIQDYYEITQGKEIELGTNSSRKSVETFPELNNSLKLEKGKLTYEGTNAGQESFHIILKDGSLNTIEKDITIETTGDDTEEETTKDEYEEYMNEIKNITDIDKRIENINYKIEELKTEYQKENNNEKKQAEIKIFYKKIVREIAKLQIIEKKTNISYLRDNVLNNGHTLMFENENLEKEDFLKKIKKGEIKDFHINKIELDIPTDYLTGKSNPANYTITDIILSDDQNFGKTSGLNGETETQYKAEAYAGTQYEDIENEKKAIKRILGLKGFLGLGGMDEDLSITSPDYGINNLTTFITERRDLSRLKTILTGFAKDDYEVNLYDTFKKIYDVYAENNKINRETVNRGEVGTLDGNGIFRNNDKKYLAELGELYTKYKNGEGGDYFNKVFGLLENYFVKGINGIDNFTKIYNNENIGTVADLIDPDKRKQALDLLFEKNNNTEDQTSGFQGIIDFQDSDELKELEKIAKNIDFENFRSKLPKNEDEKAFEEIYNDYKTKLINKEENDIDNNGNPNLGDEYYNAVVDFLVGLVEGSMDIVSAVNSTKLNPTNIEYDNNNKDDYFSSKEEKAFVYRLADLNFDGRNDFGDRGLRMGLEIKNIYKSIKVDQTYKTGTANEQTPRQNLLEFSKSKLDSQGGLSKDLDKIKGDITNLNTEIGKNPGLLKHLQNTLVNSPIPIEYILRYGADATQEYFTDQEIKYEDVNGFEKFFDNEIQILESQGVKDTPELRNIIKPHVFGAILNNGGVIYGAGGAGLSLNTEKLGTFSLSLGYGNVPGVGEGGKTQELCGIVVGRNNSREVSQKTDVGVGVSGGSSFNQNLFIPMASIGAGIKTFVNENQLNEKLEPTSAKYINFGANITMVAGVVPSWGLSVGYSRDKLEGLKTQHKNLVENLTTNEGIISSVLNNTKISQNTDRDYYISEIKNELKIKYPKSTDEERHAAATNLYTMISYYFTGITFTDTQITQITHDIANAYATQRINQNIQHIDNPYIDGASIGIQFLAGYLPIPYLGGSVAWYDNLYSQETDESKANYEHQLSTGLGIEKVEGLNNENGITEDGINYLNSKLAIAHPEIKIPKLIEQKELNKGDMKKGFIDVMRDGDKITKIKIPKNIYLYVNINISPEMEPYISSDNEYFYMPPNVPISLLDYSRTNTSSMTLIIGDTKAESDDIQILPNTNFEGNPSNYEGLKSNIITKEDINKNFNTIESSKKTTRTSYPIAECTNSEKGIAIFSLKEGIKKENIDIVGGENSAVKIEDGKVVCPNKGTLSVYAEKNNKGKTTYKFYYSSNPKDKFDINYKIKSKETTSSSTKIETGGNTKTTTIDLNNIDLFETSEIDKLFNDIENDLSKMDDNNGEYATFMDAASDIVNRSMIDNSNYETAFNALKEILKNKIDGNIFDSLRAKIEDKSLSTNDKVMMVDRFKAIFSYHIDLTNGSNDGKYLKSLISGRGDIYKNLKGYDRGQKFPALQNDYRTNILNQILNNDKLDKVEKNNLFGMTAFYRLGNSHEGRSYSMTQMGSTNVLGGHMENIANNDLEATQNWFLNNLDKSGPHKDILAESLANKINTEGINKDFVLKNLENLLKGEEVDISDKKIKINLDYVFYLLGECANESIGIELKGITITETKENDNDDKTTITEDGFNATINGKGVSGGLYINSVESQNQLHYAKKGRVGAGFGVISKQGGEKVMRDRNPGVRGRKPAVQ